jgi:hypothetical protein
LEEHVAFIFKVKEEAKQETGMKQASYCCENLKSSIYPDCFLSLAMEPCVHNSLPLGPTMLHAAFLLGLLFHPEDGGDMFL